MPFTSHSKATIANMLQEVGVENIENLFDEIPKHLRAKSLAKIPKGISEMEISRIMQEKAKIDDNQLNFIGAGSYQHHIPAAVWDLVGRGEFMTAYTPYQAEASQGGLQLMYEYQTMMANLMSMEVSNASLYEGASALAEATLMAIRANRKSKSKKILIAGQIHPAYEKVIENIVKQQGVKIEKIACNDGKPIFNGKNLSKYENEDITAVVIPQPNFFGQLQEVDNLTNWSHNKNSLVIGVVNPMAMAILKPPGQWGTSGCDIACGEGQPLGVPMSSGGPYFGFMCCKQKYVRQMPGRIAGRTTDKDGKEGFCLTLQAREQHIRRSKATSNICTNQGLLVTAATIYMTILGFEGLKRVAAKCHANAVKLSKKLTSIPGIELVFDRAFFHEFVIKLNTPIKNVINKLAEQNIQAGFILENDFPEMKNCLLICSTEIHTDTDIGRLANALRNIVKKNNIEVKTAKESLC
jgi:glycine dehydrogenase subunit 1